MNLFNGVSSMSAAGTTVADMSRDLFYFVVALVWVAIVLGWFLFVTFAQ